MIRYGAFFWFMGLWCALCAGSLSADAIDVGINEDEVRSAPYATVCVDSDRRYNLENIEQVQGCFRPDSNISYGYIDAAVWVHLRLVNGATHNTELIGFNPIANLQFIDVLARFDDNTSRQFLLGGMRPQAQRQIPHRFSLFKLDLPPHTGVDLYIRHDSTSALNINWKFSPLKRFMLQDLQKGELFGLCIGIIIALIIYNLTLYISLRDPVYLYYVFFALSNSILLSSLYGVFLMNDNLFSRTALLAFPNFFSVLNLIFLTLFTLSFFTLRQNAPKFYRMIVVMLFILGGLLVLNMPRFFSLVPIVPLALHNAILALCTIVLFFMAIYALYRRFLGALFFLLAMSITALLLLFGLAHFMGFASFFAPMIQYVSVLVTLDMLFISFALSQRIAKINQERKQAEQILLEHTRFSSIGNAIAELVHQIKVPIAQLGAVSARISMLFESYANKLAKEDSDAAHDLENIVTFLDGSVSRLHQHYRTDDTLTLFDTATAIQNTLDMFEHRMMLHNIKATVSLQSCQCMGNPMTLQNILTAIVENAIDILIERHTPYPQIRIYSHCEEERIYIEVMDNAGGIRSKNPNDVFTMYYTDKATKGFGIGLALAKNLTERQLKGTIWAENSEQGARFLLTLSATR